MKIIAVTNTAFMAHNHRRALYDEIEKKANLIVACRSDEYAPNLEARNSFMLGDVNRLTTVSRLFSFIRLFKLILKEKPDKVLSFTTEFNLFSAIICFFLNIKLYANITGIGRLQNTVWGLMYVNIISLLSDKTFVQNERDLALIKIRKNKLVLLPGSGVDYSIFRPGPEFTTKFSSHFVFVGRLIKAKGYELVIEAFEQVTKSFPNAKLTIVGAKDDGNPLRARELHQRNINWVGWTHDVEKILKSTDCIVYPSSYGEGTPRALLEGLASGNCLIVPNSSGMKELVKLFDAGIILESLSVATIKDAMEQILTDETKTLNYKKNAREKSKEIYDINKVNIQIIGEIGL